MVEELGLRALAAAVEDEHVLVAHAQRKVERDAAAQRRKAEKRAAEAERTRTKAQLERALVSGEQLSTCAVCGRPAR